MLILNFQILIISVLYLDYTLSTCGTQVSLDPWLCEEFVHSLRKICSSELRINFGMDSLSNSNFHVDYNVVPNCVIVLIFNN